MSMIDGGFQNWLLAQEVEYLDFLHFIYELCHQNANGPVAIGINITQQAAPQAQPESIPIKHKNKRSPISWAELKQFEQFMEHKSNGYIE